LLPAAAAAAAVHLIMQSKKASTCFLQAAPAGHESNLLPACLPAC
jgi:hypothetical protein